MITIYHAPRSRSTRVVWLCEEMGIPYETREASFFNPSEDFLAANPLRTIPAMRDGDATMIESVAMLLYIMSKYGPTDLEVKPNEPAYADYLQYMLFAEAGLAMYGNPIIATRFQAPEDAKSNWTVDYLVRTLGQRVEFVAQRIGERAFIAGDRFTAADISLAYVGGILEFFGVADRAPKNFVAYCKRHMERPAYQRAIAKT